MGVEILVLMRELGLVFAGEPVEEAACGPGVVCCSGLRGGVPATHGTGHHSLQGGRGFLRESTPTNCLGVLVRAQAPSMQSVHAEIVEERG